MPKNLRSTASILTHFLLTLNLVLILVLSPLSNTSAQQLGKNEAKEPPTKTIIEAPLDISDKVPAFTDLLPKQALPYWQFVQKYPIAEAFIIFCFFWAFAYLIRRYAISLLARISRKTKGTLDDRIIDLLRPTIFKLVVWLGVIIAARSAGFTIGLAQYITPVALSMIVLSLLRTSLGISGMLITAMSRDPNRFKAFDIRTEPLLAIVSKIILLMVGAYIVLMVWGINPAGLLASAGIVGIAVGFAAKDTLANLFSGVFILADRPYKLGDYINLDSGERGKITHVGIRSTRLLTRDDIEITVPNAIIGNAKVVNESGGLKETMRIRLNVQCAYDADLTSVCDVLMQVANNEDEICQYPTARVRVRGFADSGIDVQLMGWIEKPEDRGRISHQLYIAIHQAFKEHNLEIPYPKRDINITRDSQ